MTSLLVWTVTYLVHSTLLITAVWATSRWVRSASARDTLCPHRARGGLRNPRAPACG